jgi:hypothetical protein
VPKETNFFIKICQERDISRKAQAMNKSKTTALVLTSSEELVDRWALRETPASVDFFKRLEPQVEETLLKRSFWRLHHRSSFLQRRFIGSHSLNSRSSGSILLQVLVVTSKETKVKDFT